MHTCQRGPASIFCLLAVLTLSLPGQADAYLFATSGVEIALHPQGPNLWEMTLESDRPLTDGAFDLNQGFASIAYTSAAPCDSLVAFCRAFDESVTSAPALVFAIYILEPTDPSLFTGVGNPVVLGQLTTTDPLTIGVNPPEWGTSFADSPLVFGGVAGFNAANPPPAPLTFVVVPEPTTALLLGAGLAALLALRRRQRPRLRSALGMPQSATDKLAELI